MNILIVDDSAIIRNTLQRVISSFNSEAEIYFSENVNEAQLNLSMYHFNLMVLDIRIGGGTGFDVLAKTKQENPETKVIMFTNYGSDSFRKKAINGGADYFFDKSDNYDEFMQVLKNFLLKENKLMKVRI